MKLETISVKAGFLGGVLGAAAWIGFIIYGFMYDYFDTVVFLTFGIGAVAPFLYIVWNHKAAELLNLLAAVSISYGVGLFFLNSYPVWADRLNHITLYGARGTLVPVVIIMALCFAAVAADAVSCFNRKNREEK